MYNILQINNYDKFEALEQSQKLFLSRFINLANERKLGLPTKWFQSFGTEQSTIFQFQPAPLQSQPPLQQSPLQSQPPLQQSPLQSPIQPKPPIPKPTHSQTPSQQPVEINKTLDLSRYGNPSHGNPILERSEYVLEYDTRLRNALWVCEHIFQNDYINKKNVTRGASCFREDEDIDLDFRTKLSDYRESNYDRGHLTPAANHKSSQKSMDETFLLSNMSPQVGKGFNRHYWARFEEFSRYLLADWEDVFICTGPLWIPKEVQLDNGTKKYMMEYEVIGNPPNVSVPTHFYKIILAENYQGNKPEVSKSTKALGSFIIPNKSINPNDSLDIYKVDKKILESYAGVKFFPKLNEQDKIISKIGDLCTLSSCVLPQAWQPASKEKSQLLLDQMNIFIEDKNLQMLEFPSNLSSSERAVVHTEAAKRGLKHYSVGINENRRVVIEKNLESSNLHIHLNDC